MHQFDNHKEKDITYYMHPITSLSTLTNYSSFDISQKGSQDTLLLSMHNPSGPDVNYSYH